jgi:hypothetical protein
VRARATRAAHTMSRGAAVVVSEGEERRHHPIVRVAHLLHRAQAVTRTCTTLATPLSRESRMPASCAVRMPCMRTLVRRFVGTHAGVMRLCSHHGKREDVSPPRRRALFRLQFESCASAGPLGPVRQIFSCRHVPLRACHVWQRSLYICEHDWLSTTAQ